MRANLYEYFFLFLLGFVGYGIVKLLSPFAGALLMAFICAVTAYPAYQALHQRFRLSLTVCAAAADALVLVLIVSPLLLLAWVLVQESTSLMAALKQGQTTVAQWREGDYATSFPWVEHVRSYLAHAFGIQRVQFQESVLQGVQTILNNISLAGTTLAGHVFSFVVDLFMMAIALFFMFRDGKSLIQHIKDLIPMRQHYKELLMERIRDTVIGVVRGVLLTSFMQGILSTFGYLMIGAESAVLLGALTSLVALIPVVGTAIVWIPVSVYYFLKGSYLTSCFVWLWGVLVVVGLMDSLIRPYLVGKKLAMPTAVLFFALLGGVTVWGAKGLLLGPLLVAVAPLLVDMYRQRYTRQIDLVEHAGHSSPSTSVAIH